ncbi:MAG: right-handed parallel beta-helix repeat-containing protein [Phycisphaerales bacterium]|nr:right-handed parallel beta-helix repeat-containing protein [Phycisphaerales bacterium]
MKSTALVASVFLTASIAHAQTITVTTLNDVTNGSDGVVSLREAVATANNTPGAQTIEFAIPESEFWTGDGVAVLRLENGLWYITDDETTIDFSSQTTNIGDTNPTGLEVGVFGLEPNGWGHAAIVIHADNCTIKGMGGVQLRTPSIEIQGNNNRVIGCETLGVEIGAVWQEPIAMNNIIGGTEPGEGNILGSIDILSWADNNTVIGNEIKTIRIAGTDFTHFPTGNRIGGPTPEERNVIKGFGRFGEEGFPTGQGILLNRAHETIIEGNYIGTTSDGMSSAMQRGIAGIEVRDATDTIIRNNLISGLYVEGTNHASGLTFGTAIHVNAVNTDTDGVIIQGNLIGTDATGLNRIQTYIGLTVAQSTGLYTPRNTLIGGTQPGQGNTIAFADTFGVLIGPLTTGATISGNSIHSNTLLGIDLIPFSGAGGPTSNDPLDIDTNGGNSFQNFPVIDSASSNGSSIIAQGNLPSSPNTDYAIEFFASPECDPSGFGEGQLFLGQIVVATDASGDAPFSTTLSVGSPVNWVLSATATELLTGNTSEFSMCSSIAQGCPADLNGDGELNFFDISEFLNTMPDFNSDGDFNFFDVSAFLNAFSAGCP